MNAGRATKRLVAILIVLSAAATVMSPARAAPTEAEREAEVKLLRIVNRAREAQELKPLKEHDVILDEARAQSERMANAAELNHAGLEARKTRIAKADSGIDADEICEAVASAPVGNVKRQMKKIFAAWRGDEEIRGCPFDGLGYTARSAAVGIVIAENTYWVTFIAAADDTGGRNR